MSKKRTSRPKRSTGTKRPKPADVLADKLRGVVTAAESHGWRDRPEVVAARETLEQHAH